MLERLSKEEWDKLTPEEKKKIQEARKKAKKEGLPEKNDWKWYAITEQNAKDFGSIAYNKIPGVPMKIEASHWNTSVGSYVVHEYDSIMPNVMAIDYIPSIGAARVKSDGVNIAARQLYQAVRRTNSGAKNYETPDLMMYILAMRDIYREYFELKRILGVANFYDIENHSIPEKLLAALRIAGDDLSQNYAQYRGRLNLLCNKINAMAVPKYFKAFDRAAYISSFIFADSTSIRGQMYVFTSDVFYTWSGTASSSGTSLVANRHSTGAVTFNTRLIILESMIDALFEDDDATTMGGDIKKRFGAENLYSVQPTPEDYVVAPIMDEDILAQIENSMSYMSFATVAFTEPQMNITQSAGIISCGMYTSVLHRVPGNVPFILNQFVFNSHKDKPDYTDSLEWSRLMLTFDGQNGGEHGNLLLASSGLEVVEQYRMISTTTNGETSEQVIVNWFEGNENVGNALIAQFDWHPILYSMGGALDGNSGFVNVVGDLKKYTLLAKSTIRDIHSCAITASFWAHGEYAAATDNG